MVLLNRNVKIKSFGDLVRRARIKRGLSQRELGVLLLVHGQFISNFERGTSSVPLKKIGQIVAILQIDPEEAIDILVLEKRKKLERLLNVKKSRPGG